MSLRVIIVIFLIALGIGIAFFFLMPGDETVAPMTPNDPFGTGGGSVDGGGGTTPGSGDTLALMLSDGTQTYVPDFRKVDQPPSYDPSVQGYQVGGSDTGDFQILYFETDTPGQQRILVSLLAEPIGENRLAAEEILRTKLGLSNNQLCALKNVQVWTAPQVNDTYSGYNLGLSFCPGATRLP